MKFIKSAMLDNLKKAKWANKKKLNHQIFIVAADKSFASGMKDIFKLCNISEIFDKNLTKLWFIFS